MTATPSFKEPPYLSMARNSVIFPGHRLWHGSLSGHPIAMDHAPHGLFRDIIASADARLEARASALGDLFVLGLLYFRGLKLMVL